MIKLVRNSQLKYFSYYCYLVGVIAIAYAILIDAVFRLELSLSENFQAGKVLLIDKPLDWTSFDVVKKVRNSIRIKKVGHAGTLDPLTSGLLVVCTGKKTKSIESFMAAEKEYTGTITLGAVTPTYDLESEPEQFKPFEAINEEDLEAAEKNSLETLCKCLRYILL